MKTKSSHFVILWGMPACLALITIAGLLLAIMGLGVWHYLSWIALFVPVWVMTRHSIKFFK